MLGKHVIDADGNVGLNTGNHPQNDVVVGLNPGTHPQTADVMWASTLGLIWASPLS